MVTMTWRRLTLGALAVASVLALSGCGGSSSASDDSAAASDDSAAASATESKVAADTGPTVLEKAAQQCEAKVGFALVDQGASDEHDSSEFVQIGDEGRTLTITQPFAGEITTRLSVLAGTCVLDETDAPDSVRSEIEQTTAMMGRQEAEWDGVSLSYSYHPQNGFGATFTLTG